jgi:hypothetical protein
MVKRSKVDWSVVARKAWATKRARATTNKEKCPYNYKTDVSKYTLWHRHMRKYGKILSREETRVLQARKGIARKNIGTQKKDYDAPKKNEFRAEVVRMFPKTGECLTLDGRQELFSKATPYLKHTVYEYNRAEFKAMQNNPRRNVETLRNKDVVDAPIYDPDKKYSCAFVDWMGTFYTHKADLERLAPYLDSCKSIAFTFSVWGGHLSVDRTRKAHDYKMDLVGKLMNIFRNFEYKLSMPYCDTSPMVGIILVKRGVPAEIEESVFAGDIDEKQIHKTAVRSINLSTTD